MKTLKQIIKYTNANALEVLWVELDGENETPVRRQAYSDRQMDMLRQDIGAEMTPEYEAMIAKVEANIQPDKPTPLPVISCTPWQIRKKLNKEGLRAVVEAYVSSDEPTLDEKDAWALATEFREDDPLLVNAAKRLGISDLHAFIEDAKTL